MSWKPHVKQMSIHISDTGIAEISCLIFHGLSKLIIIIDMCWEFKSWKQNVKQMWDLAREARSAGRSEFHIRIWTMEVPWILVKQLNPIKTATDIDTVIALNVS